MYEYKDNLRACGYRDMSSQKDLTQNFDVNVDEPCQHDKTIILYKTVCRGYKYRFTYFLFTCHI